MSGGYLSWISANLSKSFSSRYMRASVVYFVYVCIIQYIQVILYPHAEAVYTDDVYYDKSSNYVPIPTDSYYQQRNRSINELYIVAGIIHLLNAFQYIYAWFPLGFGVFSWVMIPEWLNVLGAVLYLVSASEYDVAYFNADALLRNHYIETVAATVEFCAAIGWCWVWWYTHVRGPGRGLTLDDPDFTANIFIVVPSIIYIVYNASNLQSPQSYDDLGPNSVLYQKAELLYAVGSALYLLCALRDDGWYESFHIFGAITFKFLDILIYLRIPWASEYADWLRVDEGAFESKPLIDITVSIASQENQQRQGARDGSGKLWPVTGRSWAPFNERRETNTVAF